MDPVTPCGAIGSWIRAGVQPLGQDRDELDWRLMDRRLARRNLRTALITAVIGLLMFALTFVAALLYVA
jgi:hypothetical protein